MGTISVGAKNQPARVEHFSAASSFLGFSNLMCSTLPLPITKKDNFSQKCATSFESLNLEHAQEPLFVFCRCYSVGDDGDIADAF